MACLVDFSLFTLFVSFELFLFKFVSDFQSLLNSEFTFIPMLHFIRILRTKDNKKQQLETMDSNRNRSNGQLMETMEMDGKT